MRAVVIGAGLGGLGAALRLQGAGHDVVVVEQRERPGGRAYRIRDGGFTWDTGPSLITMPWVLEETLAAGGVNLHSEVDLRPLDPFYRIRWATEDEHLDFTADRERLRAEVAKLSPRDAAALDGFLAALEPIYREGILDAGRRPFLSPVDLARFLPRMVRWGAHRTLWHLVASHFEHPRVREAFSFHSLFIGGDPFRVPAIYGALVHLQLADGVWYADGGVYSIVEAMAGGLDVRCGVAVERVETSGGRVRGVGLADGTRLPADVVVSNADVMRAHELLGRPAPRRRLRPSMSCFLLYLGKDRSLDDLLHHTLLVGPGYRDLIADVTRRGRLPRTLSTYVHAPARTEAAMAPAGGDSLAILLPVPNLRADVDWPAEGERLRDAILEDYERTYGLAGLRASVRVEHRMTPEDFRRELGAVDGNAFAAEPTLQQSAAFRWPNRDPRVAGMYYVGAGTHPGAGIPGVLLGAQVTAGLVAADHPESSRRVRMLLPRRDSEAVLTDARATTRRIARTFSLACRLLPRDVRDDVYRLYLVFRTLDDLVDEATPGAAARVDALERWCRSGEIASPEASILEDLAARYPIPRDALLDFCSGMREDLESRPIDTETDLDRYCYRVAGTVGLVMAALLGVRGDEAQARRAAAALGMAMQRTNILRDIDEDRANGRTYLSTETLARFGPPAPGSREALLRDQIARADALYDEGIGGICRLRRGRRAIAAAAAMYREILRQIERDGYGAREGRAVVAARRKLLVAARSGAMVA